MSKKILDIVCVLAVIATAAFVADAQPFVTKGLISLWTFDKNTIIPDNREKSIGGFYDKFGLIPYY